MAGGHSRALSAKGFVLDIAAYLEQITSIHATGAATEHSYRPALASLFASIDDTARVINEPKRSEGGMPDFVFERDGVAFGWCEAKDLPKDVVKLKGYSVEQRKRYENAYPNLIYTNGVDFEFIRDKEVAYSVSIADLHGEAGGLQPLPDNFERLETLLRDFADQKPVSIRSAQKLAELMAGKAQIIKGETDDELKADPEFRSSLGRQYQTFKDNLLPNLTPGEFADIYAETITYGMFAARLHDDTLDTFSRQEALEKLPKSNPFLRGLFQFIAGYDIPDRLKRVVDDLAEVLRASDPHSLFKDFGKFTARNDPFIHFYETFLAAYNPKKRKARGVWYTPEPVVDFIVRAVDDVLKTEFGIEDGLADRSKVTVDWDTGLNHPKTGKPLTEKREVHRVQILDPATGTGTFLAKVVQTIADRVKARAPGKWSSYVEEDLLPRLHGFELLMASYAMCHMKLDMQLTESGYTPSKNPPRLSVWLTNALEPAEREVKDLFFQQLADEARGASEVKRQTPIMCVIGNPPYSGISQNNGDWITGLIEDYKYVDGKHFGERKHWLHDDYVKFIRMSEEMIGKNPSGGVLGLITNHGYLDNPTFRGMRWHLLKTFDKIWVLDLHGNANKQEHAPDGEGNQNVFDIQQGVSIIVAARSSHAKAEKPAQILRADIWGNRASKYLKLASSDLRSSWISIEPQHPFFMFHETDHSLEDRYHSGFSVEKILPFNVTGLVSARDNLVVDFDGSALQQKIEAFRDPSISNEQARQRFFAHKKDGKYPPGDTRGWKLDEAREAIRDVEISQHIRPVMYRPFDVRKIYYRGDMVDWGRETYFRHLSEGANLGLIYSRQAVSGAPTYNHVLTTPYLFDNRGFYSNKGISQIAPLYLYPDQSAVEPDAFAPTERTLNLDPKLYAKICKAAGIDPADTDMAREKNPARAEPVEAQATRSRDPSTSSGRTGGSAGFRAATGDARPSEVKVFDYIYGVLHSPDYRETFAEFLKIDFPRIPYPANPEVFRHVSEKGEALRRLHLMETGAIGETSSRFMGEHEDRDEDSVVAAGYPKRDGGHVWINKHQYFENVPETAWNFYIGGYQPAQKWLKDRRGRALSFDDIGHYQKIVKILLETERIMGEIKLPLDLGE